MSESICNIVGVEGNNYSPSTTDIDLFELYTLAKYRKMEYLYTDVAMKEFTHYKNGAGIDDMLSTAARVKDRNIYLLNVQAYGEPNPTFDVCIFNKTNNKIIVNTTQKINLVHQDIIYVEYSEGTFGHYGVFYFDGQKLFFFDSMMRSYVDTDGKLTAAIRTEQNKLYLDKASSTLLEEHPFTLNDKYYNFFNNDNDNIINTYTNEKTIYTYIISDYFSKFMDYVTKCFEISEYPIYFDFPKVKNGFSMEITGGSFAVPNYNITENEKKFALLKLNTDAQKIYIENNIKNYILGPDNQNQFCFIWSIYFIFIRWFTEFTFSKIINDIHTNDLIPVFIIKRFLYLVIFKLPFARNSWKTKTEYIYNQIKKSILFETYFRYVMSNSVKYSELYNINYSTSNDYKLYDVLTDINLEELHFFPKEFGINLENNIKNSLAQVIPNNNEFNSLVSNGSNVDICNNLGIDSTILSDLINKIDQHLMKIGVKKVGKKKREIIFTSNLINNSHNFIKYLAHKSDKIAQQKDTFSCIMDLRNFNVINSKKLYCEFNSDKGNPMVQDVEVSNSYGQIKYTLSVAMEDTEALNKKEPPKKKRSHKLKSHQEQKKTTKKATKNGTPETVVVTVNLADKTTNPATITRSGRMVKTKEHN
jgi:hypothetical protein